MSQADNQKAIWSKVHRTPGPVSMIWNMDQVPASKYKAEGQLWVTIVTKRRTLVSITMFNPTFVHLTRKKSDLTKQENQLRLHDFSTNYQRNRSNKRCTYTASVASYHLSQKHHITRFHWGLNVIADTVLRRKCQSQCQLKNITFPQIRWIFYCTVNAVTTSFL